MSLNLDFLLNSYEVKSSPLQFFHWKKEKYEGGKSYPIPLGEQYIDLVELKVRTSFPYNFFSIIDALESLFFYLTNSRIKIRIVPKRSRNVWRKLDENPQNRRVVLFSGGLDSLCGALNFSERYRTILAHCITNDFILNRVWRLSASPELQRSILYCCDARTREVQGGTSETRSLLFLTFAYAIAASLGIRSTYFCENGSQMLDVMLGSPVYPNKWATKNTNLSYITRIENIFSSFDNAGFRIICPFHNSTKAEVLKDFRDRIRFEDTHSCFTTRGKSLMCGTCWNCFIRRMSLLAVNVDDGHLYERDPLRTSNYVSRTTILIHLLRFYANVLKEEPSALNEIELNARRFFSDPIDLASRFAKDIFLGIKKSLETADEVTLNALGKKAKELLSLVDKNSLLEREELLNSNRLHACSQKGLA
jgi:7-cyano-7-deazaguanine synthase in queuosine biosynthesis